MIYWDCWVNDNRWEGGADHLVEMRILRVLLADMETVSLCVRGGKWSRSNCSVAQWHDVPSIWDGLWITCMSTLTRNLRKSIKILSRETCWGWITVFEVCTTTTSSLCLLCKCAKYRCKNSNCNQFKLDKSLCWCSMIISTYPPHSIFTSSDCHNVFSLFINVSTLNGLSCFAHLKDAILEAHGK